MMAGMTIDVFIEPEQDPRPEPPTTGPERDTLTGFLGWHRGTLELKCSGLDAEALARQSVEPSSLSLLGLVRHMTEVERGWFRRLMAGQDAPPRYYSPEDPGRGFRQRAARPGHGGRGLAGVAGGDRVRGPVRRRGAQPGPDRGSGTDKWRGPMSLRWVLNHMIEEYARHNGHADLLRERIDGAVGQ